MKTYVPATVRVDNLEDLQKISDFIVEQHGFITRCTYTNYYHICEARLPVVIYVGNATHLVPFSKEKVAMGWNPVEEGEVRDNCISTEIFLQRLGVPSNISDKVVRDTDYFTHHGDWVTACRGMRDAAREANCDADTTYWQHQLDTLDKLKDTFGV